MTRPPPKSTLFPPTPLSRSPRTEQPQQPPGDQSIPPLSSRTGRPPQDRGDVVNLQERVPPEEVEQDPVRRGEFERQVTRSEEHTSELQSRQYLVCRLLLEKK